MPPDGTAPAPADFEAQRRRLMGLAYRMLGSVAEAEDVVQDAWIRWSAADPAVIERPAAWLTTVTARLALDRLKSARRRRETYVGPWLPEPVLTSPGPEAAAEAADTLTLGFLAMLEVLDPVSRVVFLLTDAFGYPASDVSVAVGKSPAACRQIASRARSRIRQAKPSRPSPADRALADRLLQAVASGDTGAAMALLSEDVVLITDGGPERHAARRPVVGPSRVTRFLTNIAKRLSPDVVVEPVLLNAAAGLLLRDPTGSQSGAMAFDLTNGVISAIWVVTNPDKLACLDSPAVLS